MSELLGRAGGLDVEPRGGEKLLGPVGLVRPDRGAAAESERKHDHQRDFRAHPSSSRQVIDPAVNLRFASSRPPFTSDHGVHTASPNSGRSNSPTNGSRMVSPAPAVLIIMSALSLSNRLSSMSPASSAVSQRPCPPPPCPPPPPWKPPPPRKPPPPPEPPPRATPP